MQVATAVTMLFSVLFPAKLWFAPGQPLNVTVRPSGADIVLVLTDFTGKTVDPKSPIEISAAGGEKTFDLTQSYQQMNMIGTYVLYALPKDAAGDLSKFLGTPLVIDVREDKRKDAPPSPMAIKVDPLRYAVMSTDKGDITCAFYYDAAPNTVQNFLSLTEGGFYDGLTFH